MNSLPTATWTTIKWTIFATVKFKIMQWTVLCDIDVNSSQTAIIRKSDSKNS